MIFSNNLTKQKHYKKVKITDTKEKNQIYFSSDSDEVPDEELDRKKFDRHMTLPPEDSDYQKVSQTEHTEANEGIEDTPEIESERVFEIKNSLLAKNPFRNIDITDEKYSRQEKGFESELAKLMIKDPTNHAFHKNVGSKYFELFKKKVNKVRLQINLKTGMDKNLLDALVRHQKGDP